MKFLSKIQCDAWQWNGDCQNYSECQSFVERVNNESYEIDPERPELELDLNKESKNVLFISYKNPDYDLGSGILECIYLFKGYFLQYNPKWKDFSEFEEKVFMELWEKK